MYIAATSDDIKLTLQSLDKMIRKRREVCIKVCVFIVWTGFNAIIIVCLFVNDEFVSSLPGVAAGILSTCVGVRKKAVHNEPATSSWHSAGCDGCTEALYAGTQTWLFIAEHTWWSHRAILYSVTSC